jgi:hypothetical protein
MRVVDRRRFMGMIGAGAVGAAAGALGDGPGSDLGKLASLYGEDVGSPGALPPVVEEMLESGSFPYPAGDFCASERFYVYEIQEGSPDKTRRRPEYMGVVNIIPRGRTEFSLRASDRREGLDEGSEVTRGEISKSTDIRFPLRGLDPSGGVWYQFLYRTNGSGWKSLTPKRAKHPEHDGAVTFAVISDPHVPDDVNFEAATDPRVIQSRMNGDCVNLFTEHLLRDPGWRPEGEWAGLINAFSNASTHSYILRNMDRYDFIINGGDTSFVQSYRIYPNGLDPAKAGNAARVLWTAQRNEFSPLMPLVPVYLAPGNHEGFEMRNSEYGLRDASFRWFRRAWSQPGEFGGGSPDQNYLQIVWGRGGRYRITILDSDSYHPVNVTGPNDIILGRMQSGWLEETIAKDAEFRAVFSHHPFSSLPINAEGTGPGWYARGNIFNKGDVARAGADPRQSDQVKVMKLLKKYGGSLHMTAHEHLYTKKLIGINSMGYPIYGVITGSTKGVAEIWRYSEYSRDLWEEWYGLAENHDFFDPTGITEVTIYPGGLVSVSYVVTGPPALRGNIPKWARPGDVMDSFSLRYK